MAPLTYRLRLFPRGTLPGDFATTTPLLEVSSRRGDAAPYIADVPSGDGRSIDWVGGSSTVGSYTVPVLDPVVQRAEDTGEALRLVTSALTDASARQQLGGCPGVISYRRGSAAEQTLVSGVCTDVRLVSAARFDVVVGDARRSEATREVWGTVSQRFRGVTCLIGGPVAGRFPLAGNATLPDYGPQRWRVIATDNATGGRTYRRVTIQFVRGPVKPSYNIDSGAMGQAGVDELNLGAAPYFEFSDLARVDHAYGWYPRLIAELRTPLSVPEPRPAPVACTPLSTFETDYVPAFARDSFIVFPTRLVAGAHAQLNLVWPAGTPLPVAGAEYDLLLYPADVSEHNAMHVVAPVVDVINWLWDDGGEAYDADASEAVRAAIGDPWVALRVTAARKHQEVLDALCGFFGLGVGFDATARRVLKQPRAVNAAAAAEAPLERVVLTQLRDQGTPFDLAEGDAITAVTFKTQRFSAGATGDAGSRPLDSLVASKYERTVPSDDPGAAAGEHTQTYEIPGVLLRRAGPSDALTEVNLDDYARAQAASIFDRRSRGAVTGSLPVDATVAAQPGDELVLDVPHLPTAVAGRTPTARRGGERVVQVTHRTEVPGGADLTFEDAGTEAQPQLAPTLSLGAGADARKYVAVSLTNRAALAALGDRIRLEAIALAPGAPTPDAATAGTLVFNQPAADVVDVVFVGPYDAGARVYVRARTERPAHRASAYSAWVGRTLTALAAPSGLSVAVDAGDPSRLVATVTPGEVDQPIEALVALAGESAEATQFRWVAFPPGSTRLPLTRDAAADGSLPAVVVHVRHREALPFRGVSAEATAAVAAGTPSALAPPTAPEAFADASAGTYGIDVTAGALPSSVEVWEAVETAAGSGAYAPATLRGTVPSVVSGRTRATFTTRADGRRRRLSARHVRDGAGASAFTTAVDVLPWAPSAPVAPPAPEETYAVAGAVVSRISTGTSCADPAMLRLAFSLLAPLPVGRTITFTDPATGDVLLTVAGDGVAQSWAPEYSAHGYGAGSGDQLLSGAYTITRDDTSAVVAGDNVSTAGPAIGVFCLA